VNKPEHIAVILLGSNIDPVDNLTRAARLLRESGIVESASHVWETEAVGSDGPNFLNAAVIYLTGLTAPALKDTVLAAIENQLGRVRVADLAAETGVDAAALRAWNALGADDWVEAKRWVVIPLSP